MSWAYRLAFISSTVTIFSSIAWWTTAVFGQPTPPGESLGELTEPAEIYTLERSVDLIPVDESSRPATLEDLVKPRDEVRTGIGSLAKLLFDNQRFIARIGSSTQFRFDPGLRGYILPNETRVREPVFSLNNGTVFLAVSPFGTVPPTVQTPESEVKSATDAAANDDPAAMGVIDAQQSQAISQVSIPEDFSITSQPGVVSATPDVSDFSTRAQSQNFERLSDSREAYAAIVSHNSETSSTRVLSLAGSSLRVSNREGTSSEILQPGQTISITNGILGPVQTFELERFYKTSSLAAGLGPGQEAFIAEQPPRVQEILNEIRPETIAAVEIQGDFLLGLCNLNGLGSFSTGSTNCIETPSDAPIDTFSGIREVLVELEDEEPVIPPQPAPAAPVPAAPPAPAAPPVPAAPPAPVQPGPLLNVPIPNDVLN